MDSEKVKCSWLKEKENLSAWTTQGEAGGRISDLLLMLGVWTLFKGNAEPSKYSE